MIDSTSQQIRGFFVHIVVFIILCMGLMDFDFVPFNSAIFGSALPENRSNYFMGLSVKLLDLNQAFLFVTVRNREIN